MNVLNYQDSSYYKPLEKNGDMQLQLLSWEL